MAVIYIYTAWSSFFRFTYMGYIYCMDQLFSIYINEVYLLYGPTFPKKCIYTCFFHIAEDRLFRRTSLCRYILNCDLPNLYIPLFAFHICSFGILEIYLCVYVLCIALFSSAYLHLLRKLFEGGVRLTLYTFFAFVGRGNQLTDKFSACGGQKSSKQL